MGAILFPFLAGVFVTLQNSLNGLMNPYIGALGTATVGFVIQLCLLILYQLAKERRLPPLHQVPLLYYASGLIAVFVVGAIGYCVSQMGSAVTTCCSVAGQLIMSTAVDHFGFFGTRKNRFRIQRMPGFVLILTGVLAMNLIDGGAGNASLMLLMLAVGLGFCSIIIRTLSYQAGVAAGSTIGGGLVNSIGGTVTGVILFAASLGFRIDLSVFAQIPLPCYAAGLLGMGSLLCNIAAYGKQHVFYATIFTLIGQVGAGILMDVLVFHALSTGKCIGIVMVLAGVLLDKILTRRNAL